METVKALIREIHTRSLWQVLLIYLAGAWIVLQVVDVLVERVELPSWTPTMALILLVVGLPITLAAALMRDAGTGQGHALGGLIHEIHRRSLWQVLGIFLAASWGMTQVVDALTERLSLPDWTPDMAFVLLLIGLPVCLATAFVQEGMPGREQSTDDRLAEADAAADEASKASLAAGNGTLDHPSAGPSASRRLLTWRNALAGGVGAFAVLGFSLVAYFFMWTTGIGPVGNLVAQGVITDGERVLLADFADATGEGIGDAVTEALRADLLESSVLDLVEAAEIAPTLMLMNVEPREVLSAEIALEVAVREGIGAVIDGEVASAGSGYIMVATLRSAESAEALASFRVTAAGPDEVIRAIDKLSQDIRGKSGESLRSIREGTRLERATTHSLDALRLYTQGVEAYDQGSGGTVELLEQALVRDSTFAMAWRLLFITSRRGEALTKAFQYRDRLPDLERYVVEGSYYAGKDRAAAVGAYENALRIDPDERRALNNLGELNRILENPQRALELYRTAAGGPGRSAPAYLSLVETLISLGSLEEAAVALQDFEEAYPGYDAQVPLRFDLSFAQGDLESAASHAGRRPEDVAPWVIIRNAEYEARLAHWDGRLDEARDLFLRAEALGNPRNQRLVTAYAEGDSMWARAHIEEGAREGPPLTYAAVTLSFAGDAEGAQSLVRRGEDEMSAEERERPNIKNNLERWSLYARIAAGDTVGAAETMQRILSEAGCSDACWLLHRARLHDQMNAHEKAIELYERVLRPGYQGWPTNTSERLHAMLRLGPLYEELGETEKAIDAYQRMVDQWANGDERAQHTVRRFRDRIAALGG